MFLTSDIDDVCRTTRTDIVVPSILAVNYKPKKNESRKPKACGDNSSLVLASFS